MSIINTCQLPVHKIFQLSKGFCVQEATGILLRAAILVCSRNLKPTLGPSTAAQANLKAGIAKEVLHDR